MQNITVYVSGYTETGTTEMLSPSTDGEYFKLCEILTEFRGKFREYYRMNIKTFDYILDGVNDGLQGYSNFRKCIEAEEELTVALIHSLNLLGNSLNILHSVKYSPSVEGDNISVLL